MSLDRRQAILVAIFPIVALGLLNALYLQWLYGLESALYWTADAVQYLVTPAACFLVLTRVFGVAPREFGFTSLGPPGTGAQQVLTVVLVCLVFYLVTTGTADLAWAYLADYQSAFTNASVIPAGGPSRALVILYFSASAALIEEPTYRALPWLYFAQFRDRRRATVAYVAVTSLLFSAIHCEQGPAALVATFVLGVVLALLYLRIRNVWPFIAGHFVTDLLIFSRA